MILPLFQWMETTAVAGWLRESIWAFPLVQAIHLLGLCLLGGALLIVDLRLVGLGLRRQPIERLIRQARPWLVTSVVLLLVTGLLMLLPAAAVRYYGNTSFWVKMWTLPVAALFTSIAREWMLRIDGLDTTVRTRIAGVISIGLWFTVAAAGRWIGFS